MTQEQSQVARKVSWLTVHFVLAAMIVSATAAIYVSSGRVETVDWLTTATEIYIMFTFIEVVSHLWQYNGLFRGGIERVTSWFDSSTDVEVTDG